jgi:hypothetical protein
MIIITALLIIAVILYCITGYLVAKKVIKELMDSELEVNVFVLFFSVPMCIIVAFIFWPFILAWENIGNAK